MNYHMLAIGAGLQLNEHSARRYVDASLHPLHRTVIEEVAMQRLRMSTKRRHGQSLVELAIVLPVMLLLVFGSIAAIQIAMVNYTVNDAARRCKSSRAYRWR